MDADECVNPSFFVPVNDLTFLASGYIAVPPRKTPSSGTKATKCCMHVVQHFQWTNCSWQKPQSTAHGVNGQTVPGKKHEVCV